MKFIFVRHGKTHFNEINLTQGWCDSPLSKLGVKQVENMSLQLKDYSINKAYTSPLGRLNDIFDTAEAEGNYAVTGGQTKSNWISVNLGVSQRTVQRWLKEIQNKKESPEEEKPVTKSDDKPSKSATPEDPDAPGKEDIAQAKDILSSKFASVNVTKGKITFKFETKDDLAELVEMLTGIEMAV